MMKYTSLELPQVLESHSASRSSSYQRTCQDGQHPAFLLALAGIVAEREEKQKQTATGGDSNVAEYTAPLEAYPESTTPW